MDNLDRVRELMSRENLDYYYLMTGDPHGSEYTSKYYDTVRFVSGFTGGSAKLLIGKDCAYLWTDGRYFIQAERELDPAAIELMRQGEKGVLSLSEFLKNTLKKGDRIGFDGMCVPAQTGDIIKAVCAKKKAYLKADADLISELWKDREALECNKISVLPLELCGKAFDRKLKKIRSEIKGLGATALLITDLADVMWTFNVRGTDIPYCQSAFSYGYIDRKRAVLFVQKKAVRNKLKLYAEGAGFSIEPYEKITDYLEKHLTRGNKEKIIVDSTSASFRLKELVLERAYKQLDNGSVISALKAVKNKTEISNIRHYFLQDSVAVIKFLYWLDKKAKPGSVTETEAADKLQKYRRRIDGYIEDSFACISAYGANAAMAHYEPSADNPVVIENRGFLLVDSGGQYKCATTDVTRTVPVGPLSDEEKRMFTLVAAGWADLMYAKWREGCSGRNLDILARAPLWNEGIDFNHGTGHGVGCRLSVHEGPQAIRYRPTASIYDGELKPGMLVTDEPGVYIKDKLGIRTENTLLICRDEDSQYGSFMRFEALTLVPVDYRAIDTKFLTEKQISEIDEYHRLVYESTEKFLSDKERKWLAKMCRPLCS